MKGVLIAAGEVKDGPWVRQAIVDADLIIAVDSGLVRAFDLGIVPDLLLGDLDSVSAQALAQAEKRGIPIESFKPEKDYTDTELGFMAALGRGATQIVLLGALGGRADHMLANVFLLQQFKAVPSQIVDGTTRLSLLTGNRMCELSGKRGDLLSLLPLGREAIGLNGEGLQYPLNNLTLSPGRAQGLSNVFIQDAIWISLGTGQVLVIHTQGAST